MKVTVRAFAHLREILGKELEIERPEGETVRGLLSALSEGQRGFHLNPLRPPQRDPGTPWMI